MGQYEPDGDARNEGGDGPAMGEALATVGDGVADDEVGKGREG
jgi:hypothetical protein